nr:hypothetical protein BaRGS_034379 [Batillaria attramentaria]
MRYGCGTASESSRMETAPFFTAFDGFAKLSSWRFHGNETAYFSTRFLASGFYHDSMEMGSIAPYLLFDKVTPPFDFFERLQALYNGIDNMNVNVYRFTSASGGYDYVALSDFWNSYQISPTNLSTGSLMAASLRNPDGSSLGGGFLNLLSSAHPLPEPGTDNHLTFLSSVSLLPWERNLMELVRIRSTLDREVVASWGVDQVPYMHSFSVTETHALLLAHPFYVNVACMMSEVTPFECLDWKGDMPSTLYVVHLQSGHLSTLLMDNVFTMHHVNAFNLDNGRIIMDISAYPNPNFVASLRLSILRDPERRNSFQAHAELQRYEVDLETNRVRRVPLDPPTPGFINLLDMPSLNENLRARPYCFVYGLALKVDNVSLSKTAIVKRDMCGLQRDRYWQQDAHYPVEPLFLPNPESVEEDDGLVLVPMIDGRAGRSYMAVLDARDLTLVSEAYMPTLLPYSLHGRFFPEIV